MGKVLSRSKKSKQKRRMSQSKKCPKRSKGSEPGSASGGGGGCMDLGKKRVAIFDENHVILSSPERSRYAAGPPVDLFKENNSLPSTPRPDFGVIDYESRLESLPMELLVKILCHMHHDQLKAVFHVSERIRTAVIVARRFHFNYTTPDRSRQEMLNTMTPLPTQHWPFVSKEDEKRKVLTLPRTPKAPRHGPRPPSRLKFVEMRQVAAVLFQESAFPPRYTVPSALPKPKCRSFPSNRVLFDEELELCQAVAQNKLR
uniref:F-box protein At4g35930-like n=1 Tax=Erigeron canadensis TaxID=72917 RepID=UPI001CB97A76|nr:F-box protein At4g35930-like [Erigeron canadensis]